MNRFCNPLVSVIIISYQSRDYILETLDSVKAQSWENIELIVSDDASTDGTFQIVTDWLKDNQERFIHTTILGSSHNNGIPANCARGLSKAKGDWVKFIAADDILIETCIEDNINVAKHYTDVSFIISDLIEIDKDSKIIRLSPENKGLQYFLKNQRNKHQQLKAYARWPAFLNTPSFFYKREIIENSPLKKPDNYKIYEDTTIVFFLLDAGVKIHYLNKPTVKYRVHKNAISRSKKMENKREKEAYKVYKDYRMKYLSPFNPIDWSVYYESWIRFKFKGIKGRKGESFLKKFSLFYWHLRLNGIKV